MCLLNDDQATLNFNNYYIVIQGEKKPTENGDDPFGEDEDVEAMAAIAKKFEEKYVNGYSPIMDFLILRSLYYCLLIDIIFFYKYILSNMLLYSMYMIT